MRHRLRDRGLLVAAAVAALVGPDGNAAAQPLHPRRRAGVDGLSRLRPCRRVRGRPRARAGAGLGLPHRRDGEPRGRHGVPAVARRAGLAARHRRRRVASPRRRHHCRAAASGVRHPRPRHQGQTAGMGSARLPGRCRRSHRAHRPGGARRAHRAGRQRGRPVDPAAPQLFRHPGADARILLAARAAHDRIDDERRGRGARDGLPPCWAAGSLCSFCCTRV